MDKSITRRARKWNRLACLMLLGSALATAASAADPADIRDGYMRHDDLAARVQQISADRHAHLEVLAESIEGREIFLLTLTDEPDRARRRPALLITAGLDGRHWVGTETAVRVAEHLLDAHRELLGKMTVYVFPRVNPDGAEINLTGVNIGHIGNLRPVDLDRDGLVNEDGPNDLLGNGVITMMRRPNPPLGDRATHVADPAEPRLLKEADSGKGEQATYSIWIEGIDEDGDGMIAEDGPGGVDLDRNFMHLYPEHARDAGRHQVSEPESLALAEFVVEHRNIIAAITYGRHDNMINLPDHRARDVTGRTPVGIDGGDLPLYQQLSDLFKETTGQQRAPQRDIAGSFHAWLYAHRGIPSMATIVWGRPDVDSPEEAEQPDEEGDQPTRDRAARDDPVTGVWTGTIDLSPLEGMGQDVPVTEMPVTLNLTRDDEGIVEGTLTSDMGTLELDGFFDPAASMLEMTADMGGEIIEITLFIERANMRGEVAAMGLVMDLSATRDEAEADEQPRRERDRPADRPADAEATAWLAYSDSRDGIGFVEWTEYDHPQLGRVEIGGFIPGFKMNPPADELDELAAKQADFAAKVMQLRPQLRIDGPQIKRLGSGLYEVRLGLVNDGRMPTGTVMSPRTRAVLPTVLRLSTPVERIVSGDRINRAWRIEAGARREFKWILREDDGATIEIEMLDDQLGDRLLRFTADDQSNLTVTDLPEDRR